MDNDSKINSLLGEFNSCKQHIEKNHIQSSQIVSFNSICSKYIKKVSENYSEQKSPEMLDSIVFVIGEMRKILGYKDSNFGIEELRKTIFLETSKNAYRHQIAKINALFGDNPSPEKNLFGHINKELFYDLENKMPYDKAHGRTIILDEITKKLKMLHDYIKNGIDRKNVSGFIEVLQAFKDYCSIVSHKYGMSERGQSLNYQNTATEFTKLMRKGQQPVVERVSSANPSNRSRTP